MADKKPGKRAQMVAEAVARLNAAGIPAVVSPAGDAVVACGISVAPPARTGLDWTAPGGISRGTPESALAADMDKTAQRAAADAKDHRTAEARSRARAEALEKCAADHAAMAERLRAMPGGTAP